MIEITVANATLSCSYKAKIKNILFEPKLLVGRSKFALFVLFGTDRCITVKFKISGKLGRYVLISCNHVNFVLITFNFKGLHIDS